MKLNKENKYVKIVKNDFSKKLIAISVASILVLYLPGCTLLKDDVGKFNSKVIKEISENELSTDSISDFKLVHYKDKKGKEKLDIIWVEKDSIGDLYKAVTIRSLGKNKQIYEGFLFLPKSRNLELNLDSIYENLFGKDYQFSPALGYMYDYLGYKEKYTLDDFKSVLKSMRQQLNGENTITESKHK